MVIVNYRNMKLILNKYSHVQTVNDTFSHNAQTQQEVLHSISHSAFNVLNILLGRGYIKE
jgi:hypothetical protein